jgi:hypothetical protein
MPSGNQKGALGDAFAFRIGYRVIATRVLLEMAGGSVCRGEDRAGYLIRFAHSPFGHRWCWRKIHFEVLKVLTNSFIGRRERSHAL